MPFEIEDFWREADLQPEDMREKNASLWALRWLVHRDHEAKAKYDEVSATAMSTTIFQHELEQRMDAIGEDEMASIDDIEEWHSCYPLLSKMIIDVDKDIEVPAQHQDNKPWMEASTAIDMVEGKIPGASMEALIGYMTEMGVAEKEERMDVS